MAQLFHQAMRIIDDNLPPELDRYRESLHQCFQAFARVKPIHRIYLFGSYARHSARPDSDLDLCIVAEGAEHQLDTARQFRRAIRDIRSKPAFTLIPIAPRRLEEKRACGDHFFQTVMTEGVVLAEKD
jgi:predicted nucleotidyltransferase